jgi:putative pyruvate formate lyase activating enzyme
MQGLAGAACRTGDLAVVGSYGAHFGEEAPLSGRFGSGTIFFGGCNMRCLYCQNWQLSWKNDGREVSAAELAKIMLRLQDEGCHNINLVSPSHVVAQILEALVIAAERGLRLPLVYNSGGYDSPEALALLDGVIDIYMPDIKYGDSDFARKYSKVRDYVEVNDAALKEMHRQVGDLLLDDEGLAVRGLLVRHLVLPSDTAGSDRVLRFLAEEISTDTYLNIMAQSRPCYRAGEKPELDRRPTRQEVARVFELARRYGLHRLDDRGPARVLYW